MRPCTAVRLGVGLLAACVLLAGVTRGMAGARQEGATALPRPSTSGGMSLTEALAKRRSVRAYAPRALTPSEVGQLCWAASGITEPSKGLRTAPSAMTLYSIHIYVVDARGVHEYLPKEHALKTLHATDVMADLRAIPPNPPTLGGAPAVIVLGVHLAPLEARVGARAERYAMMEAGHVAQNVLLQATALGLGSIPVGGFDEAKVNALLKLPEGVRPVYLLPAGAPAG